MSIAARARPRRVMARVCAAAALAALVASACFLPFAGRYLVREDPLEAADAIFVLAGGRVDRWLEGVELFRERHAPAIVLSPGRQEKAEIALRAKGIRFPTEAEAARDAMLQLGVPPEAVQIMAGSVDNTAQEAEAFRHLAAHHGWRRVIVVTSGYHTRRTAFAFRREIDESAVRLMIRASRYDDSEPARWWRHRGDIRMVTSELQKLVLYGFGLGG
jgi:uncharacterized SAM-binding protein YcdF (DUF218 family)